MGTLAPVLPNNFGMVTVDGVEYQERPQIFAYEVQIETPGQTFTNLQMSMPGTQPFLLKGMSRDILAMKTDPPPHPGWGSYDRRFRFKLSNSQGSTWFFSSGLWIFDDRVVDTMCFGSGQFPYPLIPPVPVPANGSLFIDVQDMGNLDPEDPDYFPYHIYFAFHGSFLTAVTQTQPIMG